MSNTIRERIDSCRNWLSDHQAIAIGAGVVIILIVISALIR